MRDMKKAILFLGLTILPALVQAETISGEYISKSKNDVSLLIKRIGKIARPSKKGAFSLKNVDIDNDTLVVKSPRFENSVLLPIKGTCQFTITEEENRLVVKQAKAPFNPPTAYNGIIVTKESLEKTGERMALAAINLKIPRQNSPTTFSGNTEPLYFIDGLLTSDISTIPLSEIAYAEVVRATNAESASLGARGANGMILLTTENKYHVENPDWNEPREFTVEVPVTINEIPQTVKDK